MLLPLLFTRCYQIKWSVTDYRERPVFCLPRSSSTVRCWFIPRYVENDSSTGRFLSCQLIFSIGKRYNVLRKRLDDWDYDLDQLILGTMLFTLISFLFPTISVYYILFAMVDPFPLSLLLFPLHLPLDLTIKGRLGRHYYCSELVLKLLPHF